jgi:hypothetical protein
MEILNLPCRPSIDVCTWLERGLHEWIQAGGGGEGCTKVVLTRVICTAAGMIEDVMGISTSPSSCGIWRIPCPGADSGREDGHGN